MGLFSRLFSVFFSKQKVKIVIAGLDNSGKTTIVNSLKPENQQLKPSSIQPTIGFANDEFDYMGVRLTALDMAGQSKYRDLWAQHLNGSNGFVFVIDVSDALRMVVVKDELDRLLQNSSLGRNVPLLFFANKCDLVKTFSQADLEKYLGLDVLTDRVWKCVSSNALSGTGVEEGMSWLVESVKKNL
jgi:ADP-ribosylation factor-like protein 6